LTARELLGELRARGAELAVEGASLRLSAARGVIDDALKAAIADHKTELIALLTSTAEVPASYFQERLWAAFQLDPASTAFNVVSRWLAPPVEDVGRLAAAIEGVVSRHEILRTAFIAVDGAPRPVARDTGPPATLFDLRGMTPTEQRERLDALMSEMAHTPFDMASAPPARFTIARISDVHAAVIFAAHHIVVDVWSCELVRRDIAALCQGETLPPVLQYRDFAASQRRGPGSRRIADHLDWWATTLAGAPPASVFPPDHLPSGAAAAGVVDFTWDQQLSAAVRGAAARAGATLYMAMVAACAAILRVHTGQSEVVIGNPTGDRERTELEAVVGPFVNVQPLRIQMEDDQTFTDLVRRTRDVILDAHEHRDVPLELMLERIRPQRSASHGPLFQVAVVQHNAEPRTSMDIMGGGALHDVTVFFREVEGRIVGSVEYRADLFTRQTMTQVVSELEVFLAAAGVDPLAKTSTLPLMTAEARRAVLEDFNRTAAPVEATPFVGLFERWATRVPDRAAVAFEGVELTYGALNARATDLARALRQHGVRPGIRVGIFLERSLDLLVTLIAVQKARGTYVPLDTAFPRDRLTFMLEDSGAAVLVAASDATERLALPPDLRVISPDRQPDRSVTTGLEAGDPADLAYVIYTSGSTGRPKGVVVSAGALTNFLLAMQQAPGLAEDDVLAAVTTVSFDIAALELYLPLVTGARVELLSRETSTDDRALGEALATSGATVLQATPATWRMLVDAGWRPTRPTRALCGGEALPRELADELLVRVDELWNLYGPTETTVWSTVERVSPGPAPVSIGSPIANTKVYVVNPHGQPVPIGAPGELWIGGAGVATEYHARPELTAEKFLADPFASRPGARVFRTGDAARWDATGRLHHLGRLDQQLKIRGFRIEPGEIEAALIALPAVRHAAVVGRELGPGEVRLVAYLVFQEGEALTSSEIRRHLRGSLPAYMIPSLVVTLDALPRTPNGKLDRDKLPDPFREATTGGAGFVAPAPGAEENMARLWCDILHIDRVGADDNFFEIGGHSLLALRVAAAVENRFGQKADPRLLFFRTLRQFTAVVVSGAPEGPR